MNNLLSCEIIRDLLPSYADGLTCDVTNRAVEAHLADCPACGEILRHMKEPEPRSSSCHEVDYLKKVRQHSRRRSLFLACILFAVSLALLSFRVFYVGHAGKASDFVFDVTAEGAQVHLTVRAASSGLGIARVTFSDSAGMVQVKVYTAPRFFFNHGDYMASYTALSEVGRVSMGDRVLWEEGVPISSTASALYAAVHPYTGDMPANANLASLLGIPGQLGPYQSELQTSAEPYGWTLLLEKSFSAEEEPAAKGIMTADACVLLAGTGNLGSVTFRYTAGDRQRSFTVTEADATAFAGMEIKQCASSASSLQALLDRLTLMRGAEPACP